MMVLKRPGSLWVLLLIVLSVLAAVFVFRTGTSPSRPYTFINQTSDHRFDESIMISIKAATKRSNSENVVMILPSLPTGKDLSTAAETFFHQLRVGERYQGRGILFLYVPSEHALKIEVGYALESLLPDVSLRILEEAAKSFIYVDRDQDFWAELLNTVNMRIQNSADAPTYDLSHFRFLSGGAGRISYSYDKTREQPLREIQNLPPGPNAYRTPPSDLTSAIELYLQSLRAGIYDPGLGILDPDTQIFRLRTPMTMAQLERNADMMSRAGLSNSFFENDYAFVFFKPGHPVLPLVFHRDEQRQWRIHEPLSWALFHRFEDSNQVFLKYPLKTSDPGFQRFLARRFHKPLYPFAAPMDPGSLDRLSVDWQLDYFRQFDLEKLRPRRGSLPLEIQLDVLMNLGLFGEFLQAHRKLLETHPNDASVKANHDFYQKELVFDESQWRKEL